MNIIIWVAAGGILGWIALKFLHANKGRGMPLSIVIGMAGGFLGGSMLTPLFSDLSANPGAFSPFSLFLAVIGAAACLTISNMIARRYGR